MSLQDYYIEQLSKMLRIPTISYYDIDNPKPFSEFRELLPMIFTHLFETAEIEIINGSILIHWLGNDSQLPSLYMNHHDVVSAQDGWSHDPFSAEVSDGAIWGRGTLDTKTGLWAMLQAADELCKEKYVPKHDIYFFSSCNEETTFYGAKETSEILFDRGIKFDMVLDEGGMAVYEPISGAKDTFAMIGCGERGCVDLKFTAKGKGGHASCPDWNTPLVRLGKFMAKADKMDIFDVEIEKPIIEMFKRLASSVSGPMKLVYSHPILFKPLLKIAMPRLSATSRALVQTTLAFTMANGAERCSIMPTEASVCCNMRFSHHQGYKNSLEAVSKLASKYDIETEVLDPGGETELSEFECPQFKKLESAIGHAFNNRVIPAPYIMTGCSDARYMSKLSDNIYHFSPFIVTNEQVDTVHGIDENIGIDNLIPAVNFYRYLFSQKD